MTSLTNDDLANELRLALLRVERLAQELRDRGRGETVDAAMKAAGVVVDADGNIVKGQSE
jgi:hypothetical protein